MTCSSILGAVLALLIGSVILFMVGMIATIVSNDAWEIIARWREERRLRQITKVDMRSGKRWR